jgi:thioredoxin-related protein
LKRRAGSGVYETHMKKLMLALAATVAVGFSVIAAEAWGTDYAAAQTQAKKDGKVILIDFTGSDWCSWCVKIDKEIFAKTDFKTFSAKNLLLVELDFPQGKQLSAALKAQNDSLGRQFKVDGYPTLVLLDPAGKEVGRWVGFKPSLLDEIRKITGTK